MVGNWKEGLSLALSLVLEVAQVKGLVQLEMAPLLGALFLSDLSLLAPTSHQSFHRLLSDTGEPLHSISSSPHCLCSAPVDT